MTNVIVHVALTASASPSSRKCFAPFASCTRPRTRGSSDLSAALARTSLYRATPVGAPRPDKVPRFDRQSARTERRRSAHGSERLIGKHSAFRKGAWWVVVNTGGRRKSKSVGDRETALRIAQAVRERLARAEFSLTPATDTRTLQQYAKDWLVTAKGALKASTVTFYEGALKQHIVPALGSRLVASLNREDCRSLIATCRGKGLKVATVRGIARTLSTILTQAVEDQVLVANPALRLGRYLRYGDHEEPQPDPLAPDEVTTVLATARQRFPEWYPFLLCALRTGMRLGELLELQ
jgi:hypothetical protein